MITSDNDTINAINRVMSKHNEHSHHSFYGFIPIHDGEWGVEICGQMFAAVHAFQTYKDFFWGCDPRETKDYANANPWVLMFAGNDLSVMLRFKTKDQLIRKITAMKFVDCCDPEFLTHID